MPAISWVNQFSLKMTFCKVLGKKEKNVSSLRLIQICTNLPIYEFDYNFLACKSNFKKSLKIYLEIKI